MSLSPPMNTSIITHAAVGGICIIATWLVCANNAKKAIALRDKAKAEAEEAKVRFEKWKSEQKSSG